VTELTVSLLLLIALQAVAIVGLWMGKRRWVRRERATSEDHAGIRFIADHAPVMIWTARPDKDLDYLNQTCVEFTGCRLDQLLGGGWLDTVHPDDLEPCARIYEPAFAAQTPFIMEFRMRRHDGSYRWILDTAVPKYADGVFAGYVGCSIDITERRVAEEESRKSQLALERSHHEIQQLAGQLIGAHEDERRRLARELHDDVTQRLALLAIEAGRMESAVGAPEGVAPLRRDLIRLSEDVHALSYRLHPSMLDDLGLTEALRTECERVARNSALRVEVSTQDVPISLAGETSLCLFRVAQEALSNASRHARASAVTVMLSPSGRGLELAIKDDGCGFDDARPRERASLGLASMRERVRIAQGKLDIKSKPGRGTSVVAWVPA